MERELLDLECVCAHVGVSLSSRKPCGLAVGGDMEALNDIAVPSIHAAGARLSVHIRVLKFLGVRHPRYTLASSMYFERFKPVSTGVYLWSEVI